MSSKYLEKAWSHRCVTMEEKLILVALAELADREGAIITTIRELMSMTSGSESSIVNLVGKLSINNEITGLNRRSSFNDGYIKCRLNIGDSHLTNMDHSENASDSHNGANKLSKFQRSQAKPINNNRSSGKMINITELSPLFVEEWAEIVMFKSGFSGQTSAWASFVEKVRSSSKSLIDLDDLTSQLHAHLCNEKHYKLQSGTSNKSPKGKVKLSPQQTFAQKLSNFNFDD